MVNKLPLIAGAVALAAATAPARAAPESVDPLKVNSFAELLAPIPDAQTKLASLNAATPAAEGDGIENVQYHHHHHHHHHRWWRHRHHHHHHHHWHHHHHDY